MIPALMPICVSAAFVGETAWLASSEAPLLLPAIISGPSGEPVYWPWEGPLADADILAAVCAITNTSAVDGKPRVVGTGLYLGNGRVVTVEHVTRDLNFALPTQVIFAPRDSNGDFIDFTSPTVIPFEQMRLVPIIETSLQESTTPDFAILEVDLTADPLSDIVPGYVSTSPIRNAVGTSAEVTLGVAEEIGNPVNQIRTSPHTGIRAGWGTGTYGLSGARRLRYGAAQFTTASDTGWSSEGVVADQNDSGSPALVLSEAGSYVSYGVTRNPGSGIRTLAFARDVLYDFYEGAPRPTPLDVTGEAGSGGVYVSPLSPSEPLRADGTVDLHDAVFAFAGVTGADGRFDFNADGVVNPFDWDRYVADLNGGELNPYGPEPMLPLAPGILDIDGDGRCNHLDILALAASGITDLRYDFNLDGAVLQSDATFLTTVVSEFGHGVFGDMDGDADADADDILAFIAHDQAVAGAFDVYLWGDPAYRLVLDADVDGDNDANDALALRELFDLRLDLGDIAREGFDLGSRAYTGHLSVDALDRQSALVARSFASQSDRHVDLMDNTGSRDVASPLYGVPDGHVDAADLWWYYTEHALLTGSTDPLFASGFDANQDGRMNLLDVQWYSDNAGSTNPSDLVYDLDSDGVISLADATRMMNLLYLPYVEQSGPLVLTPLIQTEFVYPTLNHGVVGNYDADPVYASGDVNMFITAGFLCNAPGSSDCVVFTVLSVPDWTTIQLPVTDCTDRSAILAAEASGDFAFDGRLFGDAAFRFSMDFDLDGDNDARDKQRIMQMIEPADANGDGVLDPASDFLAWNDAFSNGDPMADANLDGVVNSSDYFAWVTASANPVCP